ncbi:MAG: hypothetical protein AB1758_34950 [Candidatus Eremiobacterota bacterium]
MDLTQSQILELMRDFAEHARRIQEIKDTLLYARFFGHEEDLDDLCRECANYDELLREIRVTYHQKMLPLVERAAAFLAAHPRELALLEE